MRDDGGRGDLHGLGEFGRRDFRPLHHADGVENEPGRMVVRARALEEVDQVFRIAQVGEIRIGDHHHFVCGDEGAPGPSAPDMRDVEHAPGRRGAHRVEQRIERRFWKIEDAIQDGRRREKTEAVAALGQHPIDERGVDTVGVEHGVRNALQRILIEIERGRAEGEVEIGDDRGHLGDRRKRPGQVVRNRRSADTALCPHHPDQPAERFGAGRAEEFGDCAQEIDDVDRRYEIFVDAARHELAIKNDIVRPAKDDDLRPGVAQMRQRVEPFDKVAFVRRGFQHDDVRRRRILIGLDRGRRAAHILPDVRLGHPSVRGRRFDQRGGLGRLAEGMDGDAWNRIDPMMRTGRRVLKDSRGGHWTLPPIGVRPVDHDVTGSWPLTDILDCAGAHRDVGRTQSPGLDEIARVVDLRGDHGLGRASEIFVWLVLPAFEGRSGSEVLRPQSAGRHDLRLEAHEGQSDRRCAGPVGDVRARADPGSQTRIPQDLADFVHGPRIRARAAGDQDHNFARAERAVSFGE